MLPQRLKKTMVDSPKKLANLIDLVNLPSTLRDFVGQSQTSRLGCFMRVWSYIKENNLQDPQNKNLVNCDEKLKSILLGKSKVDLAELPALIKLHFPKESKWFAQLQYSRQGALHPLLYVLHLRTLALHPAVWSERYLMNCQKLHAVCFPFCFFFFSLIVSLLWVDRVKQ